VGLFEKIKNFFSRSADAAPEPAPLPENFATQSTEPTSQGERRPVIAISGAALSSASVSAMMTQIRSAGAEPVFIGDHAARSKDGVEQAVSRDLARADALIVMGNDNDIDPAKYGQAPNKATHVEEPARAAYEEVAIKQALDRGMPLLGICAGMQRINVVGGGTLHQDVPALVGDDHHNQGHKLPPFVPVQFVKIDEGTKLREISSEHNGLYTPAHTPLPPGVIMENSFHHQAVDKVREDFRVSARSDDGIVEAIEPKQGSRYENQFVMGVQWHPEFGASDFGPSLASRLTQEAAAYAASKQVDAPQKQETLMGQVPVPGELANKILAARQSQALHR